MSANEHREASAFLTRLAATTPWAQTAEQLRALAQYHAAEADAKALAAIDGK